MTESGMSRSAGSPISAELGLAEEARIVPVPSSGTQFICPHCERPIPAGHEIRLAKPAKYEGVLNDIFRCPLFFIIRPDLELDQKASPSRALATRLLATGDPGQLTLAELQIMSRWTSERIIRRCGFVFSPKSTAVVLMK